MPDRVSYLLTDLIGGGGHLTGKKLADLARRVERLVPNHRDPERYHEDKSEIAAELRRLAREARHG